MTLTHPLGSCTYQKSFASSLETQLQNQTSVTLTKVCTLKSWPIWTEISSALEKSIICAVVGRIFKFLKIEKIIDFFVRKFFFYEKLNNFAHFRKSKNPPHHGANYALRQSWQNFYPNPTWFKGTNLRQRNWCYYFEAVSQSSFGVFHGSCSWFQDDPSPSQHHIIHILYLYAFYSF